MKNNWDRTGLYIGWGWGLSSSTCDSDDVTLTSALIPNKYFPITFYYGMALTTIQCLTIRDVHLKCKGWFYSFNDSLYVTEFD